MFGCVFFVAPLNWWGKKYRTGPWVFFFGGGGEPKDPRVSQNFLGPSKFLGVFGWIWWYTLEISHFEAEKWRFGRWFSFSIGGFLGSMSFNVNFPGCTTYAMQKLFWCLLSKTRYCHDSWRLSYFIFTQEAKQVAKFMDDWHTLRLATVICCLGRDSYHRNLLIPRWFVQNNMMCRSNANPMPFLHEPPE